MMCFSFAEEKKTLKLMLYVCVCISCTELYVYTSKIIPEGMLNVPTENNINDCWTIEILGRMHKCMLATCTSIGK